MSGELEIPLSRSESKLASINWMDILWLLFLVGLALLPPVAEIHKQLTLLAILLALTAAALASGWHATQTRAV